MSDPKSILYFFLALTVMLGMIFVISYFTIWLRGIIQRQRPSKQKLVSKLHDEEPKITPSPELHDEVQKPIPAQELSGHGSVYDLKPDQHYTVKQDFKDFYGGEFNVGETLTFVKKDYLPYHGGHTITFAEATMYFQDEVNADILGSLWDYLEPTK